MFDKILGKIIGTKNERELKRLWRDVEAINSVFEELRGLSAADLPKKTEQLVARVADGELIDDLVPEAFALVKWACTFLLGKEWPVADTMQKWNMVPFDVQLIGGVVLHLSLIHI